MSTLPDSWAPPDDPSPNLRTVLAYFAAMETWDEAKLMDTFDDTLEHRILPKSLTRPVLTKQLYRVYFQGLTAMFKKTNKVGYVDIWMKYYLKVS